MIAPEQ